MLVKNEVLEFVKENEVEICEKLNLIRLEDIGIDGLGDVGGSGVYIDEEGYEMSSGGYAFSFKDNLKSGDEDEVNGEILVKGKTLYYISFNE